MKNIKQRDELILKKLQQDGRVTIDCLIEQLKVSGVPIRKDLKLLEDKNLLFGTRSGGSTTNPYKIERHIEKELISVKEKRQIAKAALFIIGENDAIIIGSGTTVFEFARGLHPANRLTVITRALKVALELSNRPNAEVLRLAGMIRSKLMEQVKLYY